MVMAKDTAYVRWSRSEVQLDGAVNVDIEVNRLLKIGLMRRSTQHAQVFSAVPIISPSAHGLIKIGAVTPARTPYAAPHGHIFNFSPQEQIKSGQRVLNSF